MTKKPFIHVRYLPPRLPVMPTAIAWLFWDKYDMPQWGATLLTITLSLVWAIEIHDLFSREALVPVFEEKRK